MFEQKKKLIIELDSGWVLQHRHDDQLPIPFLKAELEKIKGVEIKDATYIALTLLYDVKNADYTGIKTHVLRLLSARYAGEDVGKILSVKSQDAPAEVSAEETQKDGGQEDLQEMLARIKRLTGVNGRSDGDDGAEENDGGQDGVDHKINALVGAAEFKALAREISGIAEEIKRTKTYEVFTNQCYLFSIGDGYGLTTYLELLAQLISERKLCKMAENPVKEERLAAYRESFEPFDGVMRILGNGNDYSLRLLCVDISEWMDKTDNRYFKQFLRAVEKVANQFIVVFRVPFVDKDILERIRYSLSDLLSVKSVSFPPLSREEIKTCAEAELNRFNFSITKAAWKYFFERVSEEKSDGKFYGVNTVKKIVRELVYQKHITNSQRENKSTQISVTDAKELCDNVAGADLSGEEQLNRLIGIDGIKNRVNEIIAQIELSLKDGSGQRPCIHMRFVGNPGTGKTTVARIIGKILKERGVLRVGAFFEYAGRDFCGRYIGETAPKTASICRDAYGSVLFIDEAYSLYRGDGDTKDFGREAIDTLIAEMENHRNDFVVIMAGYTADMEKLMGGNLGLASRMPYIIEFPNFTREQLNEIFVSMVKDRFKYDKDLFEAARTFFLNLPDSLISSKDFSNARYVRNLFERTWAKAAMRCQLSGKKDIVLTRDDFEHASADKEFAVNVPKKTRIGFNG